MDAFSVALNKIADEDRWYVSTEELQLVSLPFCVACRSVATNHVIVDRYFPRRLFAATSCSRGARSGVRPRSRVPRLRARSVTWDLPSAAELASPNECWNDAVYLAFGSSFEDGVDGVRWPRKLKSLVLRIFGRPSRFLCDP